MRDHEIQALLTQQGEALSKKQTEWAQGKKIIGGGQIIRVILRVVYNQQLGRKVGEHFVTDEMTPEDWRKIKCIKFPPQYESLRSDLEIYSNRPQALHKLLRLPATHQADWRDYTRAREKINSAFKAAKLPYRLRNIYETVAGGITQLNARFIRVT